MPPLPFFCKQRTFVQRVRTSDILASEKIKPYLWILIFFFRLHFKVNLLETYTYFFFKDTGNLKGEYTMDEITYKKNLYVPALKTQVGACWIPERWGLNWLRCKYLRVSKSQTNIWSTVRSCNLHAWDTRWLLIRCILVWSICNSIKQRR